MEGILKKREDSYKNGWPISLDGDELKRVKEHLNMSDNEKNKTILSAVKILGQCPYPRGEKQQKTGLVIGKVQSGKTSSFITLTALALDNDYQIVIIFGGNTLPLLSQTENRINDSFDLNSREDFKFATYSSTINLDSNSLKNNYYSRKKIIITGLKEYTHIKNIREFIRDAGLSDEPMLIIDDEGDQMSPNGGINSNKETTTYKHFKELLLGLSFSTFISVTATPQANLLIDVCDILSPHFIELIQPGLHYSGFDVYHNEPKTKYISIIPDNENVILDEESGIPNSFEKSLSTFYVGSILRKKRGDGTNHSMLIHPSHMNYDHRIVEKKIDIKITQLKDYIESGEESLKNNVLLFLKLGIDELSTSVDEVYEPIELYDDFKKELYNTSIQVLNRDNGKKGSKNEIDYKSNRNVIVLGGKMVERGLTIKNLSVTYIIRTNKGTENADTVEQRTRWFGYRINKYGNYLDLCRVFMTNSMACNFYKLGLHEKSIWKNIEYQKKQGIPTKNMSILFELDPHFNPTRKNVIPSINSIQFGKWRSQKSIEGMVDKEVYETINNDISDFLSNYDYEELYNGNDLNYLYRNVDLKELYNNIIQKYYRDPKNKFDIDYVRMVMEQLGKEDLPLKINVIEMRKNVNEYHEIYDDYTVANIMSGRSVRKLENDPDYHKPDSDIFPNELQLQIHNVKIDKKSAETRPMIAFYCPYIGTAKRLVGRI